MDTLFAAPPRTRSHTSKKKPPTQTTIMLLGVSGQLGNALRLHWEQPEFEDKLCLVMSHRETLDIGDPASVRSKLTQIKPDVVINCAAYTHTSEAETDRARCWRTNALGPANLAQTCSDLGVDFIHVSSDFIFGADETRLQTITNARKRRNVGYDDDDIADQSYVENSPAGPIGYYGHTKLAAEHAILQIALDNPRFRYWMIRTAGLFEAPWRKVRNFPYAIANKLMRKDPVEVTSDVFTSICYAPQLAEAIAWIVDNRSVFIDGEPQCSRGTYHIANAGSASWYEIATRIATRLGYPSTRVRPVTLGDYLRSRRIPVAAGPQLRYTVLDTRHYASLNAPPLDHWEDAIDRWADEARVQLGFHA